MTFQDIPGINAIFNSISSVLLALGFYMIKKGNKTAHRNCMVGALASSACFLTGYLIYHAKAGRTVFAEPAWFRPYYLVLLLTHTVLAVVIVPMIFATVLRAIRGDFEKHKRIARWTWPLWMYVSVTGVLIYLLLYRIFPQK